MNIRSIKTKKVEVGDNLFTLLDTYLPVVTEKSILAITSKIVSICEGNIIPITEEIDKKELVYKEADYYLPKEKNKYGIILTIKNNMLAPTAGIDESNSNGFYILWPKDPQKSANVIRNHIKAKFNLNDFGVIITDSKTSPLRWGTTGTCIAYSGIKPLNNYIGKKDIFGKEMKVTKANIVDALAVSSVLVMGEGKEQTPLALISDLPFVSFNKADPTEKEIIDLLISPEDDLYGELLTSVEWKTKKSTN